MDINKWIQSQKERLLSNSSVQGPHSCYVCYLGGGNQTYPTMSVSYPWKPGRKTVLCHRLTYMLYTNNFDLPKGMEISHRCHEKHCVNPEHLSLEPHGVNMDRQICRDILPVKRCKKHSPYMDCIL